MNSVTWIGAIASGAARTQTAHPRGTTLTRGHLATRLIALADRALPIIAAVLVALWTISFAAFALNFVTRFPG